MKWRLVVLAFAAFCTLAPAFAETPRLSVASAAGSVALSLFDIADIAVSESGAITEIFVTLMPGTETQLAALGPTEGEQLIAHICGLNFQSAPMRLPLTGHIYLVQTTMMRGWALQALWQGTATCETLSPEIFLD